MSPAAMRSAIVGGLNRSLRDLGDCAAFDSTETMVRSACPRAAELDIASAVWGRATRAKQGQIALHSMDPGAERSVDRNRPGRIHFPPVPTERLPEAPV